MRIFNQALTRALVQENYKRLNAIAEKLAVAAESGEPWAIKEVADRIDGKPAQAIEAHVTGNLAGLLAGLGSQEDDPPLAG